MITEELDRDINGLIFASWFDDDMNDGAEMFAPHTKSSSIIAFADEDRVTEFVRKNRKHYEIDKKIGNKIYINSLDDGMKLVISPISQSQIKDKELKDFVKEMDADDESLGAMEVKAIKIKECVDIVLALQAGNIDAAKTIIEKQVFDSVDFMMEQIQYEMAGMDSDDFICEKYRIKVNAKGKRRRKVICRKGFKAVGNTCRRITAKEKLKRKIGMRKAVRTKKSKGSALKKRMLLRRKRALQKRHAMGL